MCENTARNDGIDTLYIAKQTMASLILHSYVNLISRFYLFYSRIILSIIHCDKYID